MMQDKKMGEHGKTVQTACSTCGQWPDPSKKYQSWMRSVNTGRNGIWADLDAVKFRQTKDGYRPVAITDLTYAKSHEPAYLAAIERRWFERDAQGQIFTDMAGFFGVPAYLVAYDETQVSVLDINARSLGWEHYTLDEWAEVIDKL